MTLFEITRVLNEAGIESARGEALMLIEFFEKVPRSRAVAEPGADYSSAELIAAVEKRATRYPLQYIFGEWEFCGLTFAVDESCLIPRSDTEIIAEEAARNLPAGGRLLDLCTGSGCIAAAVLGMTEGTTAVAVELFHDTASAARRNMERLGFRARCEVIEGDLRSVPLAEGDLFDVITANPPYIARDEMPALEPELSFEPRAALTDGGDGLSLYADIIGLYRSRLRSGGVMLLEHGYKQADAVCRIAEHFGMNHETLVDYSGNPRAAKLWL